MRFCNIGSWGLVAAGAVTVGLTLPGLAAPELPPLPELTADNLAKWQEYLRPKAEELRWREIPWRISFWEGVQEAQAKERPILFWTMDGHPLACT